MSEQETVLDVIVRALRIPYTASDAPEKARPRREIAAALGPEGAPS